MPKQKQSKWWFKSKAANKPMIYHLKTDTRYSRLKCRNHLKQNHKVCCMEKPTCRLTPNEQCVWVTPVKKGKGEQCKDLKATYFTLPKKLQKHDSMAWKTCSRSITWPMASKLCWHSFTNPCKNVMSLLFILNEYWLFIIGVEPLNDY